MTALIHSLPCVLLLPCPLLCPQDALADRDLVHRQTAATVVQHLALGVAGLSCEDALTHLLNFVWPNVFEDSPHLINGVMGAVDGCRLALGPCVVLHYTLQVGMQRGGSASCRVSLTVLLAAHSRPFLRLQLHCLPPHEASTADK